MMPNFLFAGAAKCGSTWFFRTLKAHPEVFVPRAKDIYYFDANYHRGPGWYESFFEDAGYARAIGEVSHDYLYSKEALERIAVDLPGVRIVLCLRDPIRRAYSAYLFMCRNGTAEATFRRTLEVNRNIMERGRYAEFVARYLEKLGEDRVKVFLFDQLEADPSGLAESLYAFLGVDSSFVYEDAEKKVLPASKARFQWLASGAKKGARLARRLGYPGLVGAVKGTALVGALYKPVDSKVSGISEEDRLWLYRYFEGDIAALERLLGVSLERWRE